MLPGNNLIPFRLRKHVNRKRSVPEIHQSCYDQELNEQYRKRPSSPTISVAANIAVVANINELSGQHPQRQLQPQPQAQQNRDRDDFDDQDELSYSDMLDELELLQQQIKVLKQKVSDSEACCIHQNEVIRTLKGLSISQSDKNNDITIQNLLLEKLTRKYSSIIQLLDYIPDEHKQKLWLILFDVDTEKEVSSNTKAILNTI